MEKHSKKTGNISNTESKSNDSSMKHQSLRVLPKKNSGKISPEMRRELRKFIDILTYADKPWELMEKRIEDQFEEDNEEE